MFKLVSTLVLLMLLVFIKDSVLEEISVERYCLFLFFIKYIEAILCFVQEKVAKHMSWYTNSATVASKCVDFGDQMTLRSI